MATVAAPLEAARACDAPKCRLTAQLPFLLVGPLLLLLLLGFISVANPIHGIASVLLILLGNGKPLFFVFFAIITFANIIPIDLLVLITLVLLFVDSLDNNACRLLRLRALAFFFQHPRILLLLRLLLLQRGKAAAAMGMMLAVAVRAPAAARSAAAAAGAPLSLLRLGYNVVNADAEELCYKMESKGAGGSKCAGGNKI